MAFSIDFLDNTVDDTALNSSKDNVIAEIHIGDFQEDLNIPLDYWSKSEYIKQWMDGISRIVKADGEKRSALIVEMYDPANPRYYANYWVMFKVKNEIFIQNIHYTLKKFKNGYTLEDLYKVITPRQTPDENDLYHLSEWTTTSKELEDWLENLKKLQREY